MSASKKPAKNTEDLQAALQNLILQGKKEGMIRDTELNARLEKMQLSPEKIEERLRIARREMEIGQREYEYVIVNDDLETTIKTIQDIIKKEKGQ